MHTMKGLTRTYNFRSLSEAAHIAEQFYQEAIQSKNWNPEAMLEELDKVQQVIDSYKHVSEEKLGRALVTADNFVVDRAAVEKNFDLLSHFDLSELSAEGKERVLLAKPFFSDLICEPLEKVLNEQVKTTASLARQLDKCEPLFVFSDPGFSINKDAHELINDVFTHLIKHSIDHSLELPQERIEVGKPEQGTLAITLEEKETQLQIKFSDDGRGLNLLAIYQSAIEQG